MADIPSELFIDILSHKFTDLYLKNSLSFNIILRHNADFYRLDFPNLSTHVKIIAPLNINLWNPKIYLLGGSCNGLLCISNDINECALWNPSIRKHCFIPCLPVPRHLSGYTSEYTCVHGFGFDQFAVDYKLVRIFCFFNLRHQAFDSQVRLFSSKMNSWKVLPNFPYALFACLMIRKHDSSQTMGVFVENSLHWVVIRNLDRFQPSLIVAFNLTQEVFNEVPLPEMQMAVDKYQIDVSLFGECLCMIVNHVSVNHVGVNGQTTKVEVWVMKKYGFRDSWCKLFMLDELCFNKSLISLKPLCYSSDRSKVLLEVLSWVDLNRDYKKLFWYDLKSEEVTCVPGIPNFNEAMTYVGTLLPPSVPIDDNYNNRKEN